MFFSYQLSVISYQFHAKVLRAKLLRGVSYQNLDIQYIQGQQIYLTNYIYGIYRPKKG